MHNFLLEMEIPFFPFGKTQTRSVAEGAAQHLHTIAWIVSCATLTHSSQYRFVCVGACVQGIHKKEMLLEITTIHKCTHHRRKYLN